MPEEQAGEDCLREHYVTWRGLILFLQQISQKKKQNKRHCISQNALHIVEALQVWLYRHLCGPILIINVKLIY